MDGLQAIIGQMDAGELFSWCLTGLVSAVCFLYEMNRRERKESMKSKDDQIEYLQGLLADKDKRIRELTEERNRA